MGRFSGSAGRRACLTGICVLLFAAPLTWFPNRAFDAAGDDPKLQFYMPERYTADLSVQVWSGSNALSNANIPHPNLLFSLLILALKRAGLPPGLIEKLFYSVILAGGFLFCYLLIRELAAVARLEPAQGFQGAVAGGLTFVLSALVVYTEWIARLSAVFGILVYPGVLYFFVAAVVRKEWRYLLGGALLSSVFSFALSVAAPWFFAFVIGASVFAVVYGAVWPERRATVVRYAVLYVGVMAILNLSWGGVVVESLLISRHIPMLARGAIEGAMVDESASFIRGIAVYMNALYTWLMLPSEEFVRLGSVFGRLFSYRAMYISLVLPAALAAGLLFARGGSRRAMLALTVPAAVLGYTITVQVTDLGVALFAWLVAHMPGFVMFRNFHGKFAIGFSLFYGAAIGMAVATTLAQIRRPALRALCITGVVVAALVGGAPLLWGRAVCVSAGAAFYERLCFEFTEGQLGAVRALQADREVSRVLIFPMSFAQYMAARGVNGQYYVAVPYLKVLTGKDEFGGVWSFSNPIFPGLPTTVGRLVDEYDFAALQRLLRLMNVKYVYRYTELAPEHSQMFIFKYGVLPKMEAEMVDSLRDYSRVDFGDVQLYTGRRWTPNHAVGRARLTAVDDPAWLDVLVYTDYLDPEHDALIGLGLAGGP